MEKLSIMECYWGKFSEENGYHLFMYHSLDVVAVAEVWLDHSSVILEQASKQTKLPQEMCKRIILFYVALHDLGKLDARFQAFVPKLRRKLQGSEYDVESESYNHGSYSYLHFREEFSVSENMIAVAGHHGFCDLGAQYFEPDADDELIEMDKQARKEWVYFCLDWFDLKEVPLVESISALAGLCSVSDWVGSSMTNFTESRVNLKGYYSDALVRAKQSLDEAGLLTTIEEAGFEGLFPGFTPRGIQKLLPSLPVKPGLTIVESDTGSGKTEFALAYASILIEAGLADSIVFGLPTQATANGLFGRVGDAATKLFPDSQVTLAHGNAKYLIPDDNGFLRQSSKRAFLGSMSVATVDQIMMGVLGVKHQFIRSFGTQKSVLVLDEIHSFDAYMYGLITKVLSGQHEAYSSVILLSATLPSALKEQLLDTYQGEVVSDAYPLITHVDLDGRSIFFELSEQAEEKMVKTEIWEGGSQLPNKDQREQLLAWARDGAMVGVICNTVQDAQALSEMLSNNGIEVDLFHARYALEDRKNIEEHVLNKYGKNAPRKGGLLVATQVIEQSLDLDFDVLVSQMAPIEFLMQRMGRLWRHDRSSELAPRSNVIKEPLFVTLCPPIDEVEAKLSTIYGGSGYVYKDLRALYRTQKYLVENHELSFPACYREAINRIHFSGSHEGESDALTACAEAFKNAQEGGFYAARTLSNQSSTPLKDVDPRCALLTREGEMSQSVVLFKGENLLHGGDYQNQSDRERSTVSLSRKLAKGKLDTDYHCLKATVGKDISYSSLGVFDSRLQQTLEQME